MKSLISINEVRKIQLDILSFVDEVMKKNGISYWLNAGTLLGCVRHKGYIPWDDDIDICMLRNDYERFAELINNENSYYKVLDMHKTDGYYYLFSKVVDTRTHIIEKDLKEISEMGIYIDVFPLDYLPSNNRKRRSIINKVFRLRAIIYYSLLNKNQVKKASISTKIKYLFSVIYGNKKAMRKANNYCNRINRMNGYYLSDLVASTEKRHFYPASYFDDTILGMFEGKMFPIPKNFHEYLSVVYGDYMKLPPKEKQILTHDFKAFYR